MSVLDQIPQQSREAKVSVNPWHLFSHKSRLNKEAKGGYVEGKIHFPGLSTGDVLEKVELSLISDIHSSKHHCNFLHITGSGYKYEKKSVNSDRGNDEWMVSLINDQGTMELEVDTHTYLKNDIGNNFFDQSANTILLGKGHLQLTVGIPLSKAKNDFKKNLFQRSNNQDIVDSISNFCKQGEPFMHLARLKVVAKLKGSSEIITGISNLICDKARYEFKISDISNNIILNNCALQRYTVILDKCMPPEKVSFTCNFVYVDRKDKEKTRVQVQENEIKVHSIHRTGHEKKCVNIYFSTSSGEILTNVLLKKYYLYLQLKVVENGNLGSADEYSRLISNTNFDETLIGKCTKHSCEFDRKLQNSRYAYNNKMVDEVIKLQKQFEDGEEDSNNLCGLCYCTIDNLKRLHKWEDTEENIESNGGRKRYSVNDSSSDDESCKSPKLLKTTSSEEAGNIIIRQKHL